MRTLAEIHGLLFHRSIVVDVEAAGAEHRQRARANRLHPSFNSKIQIDGQLDRLGLFFSVLHQPGNQVRRHGTGRLASGRLELDLDCGP